MFCLLKTHILTCYYSYTLRDLMPFVQFNSEKHPLRSATFSKVGGLRHMYFSFSSLTLFLTLPVYHTTSVLPVAHTTKHIFLLFCTDFRVLAKFKVTCLKKNIHLEMVRHGDRKFPNIDWFLIGAKQPPHKKMKLSIKNFLSKFLRFLWYPHHTRKVFLCVVSHFRIRIRLDNTHMLI